jgi:conflict system pore-forming effector with SLATT domain/uncharacterized protein DUF4231
LHVRGRCDFLPASVDEGSGDDSVARRLAATEVAGSAEAAWIAREQRIWSKAASGRKASIQFWRTIALALIVGSAVFATAASQVAAISSATGRALGVAAAVAAALVAVVRSTKLDSATTRDWTRCRSVAEGLKSELYAYLARQGRYRGADADERLRESGQEIVDGAGDLAGDVIGIEPGAVELPPVTDTRSYVESRVRAQIDGYYRPRATVAARRLRLARSVEFAASVTAAVLAAIAAASGVAGAAEWVPVVTTIAAAVVAHTAAAHYQDEMLGYTATANRLEFVESEWRRRTRAGDDRAADADLVRNAEEAISVENKGWMAKWQTVRS